MPRTSGGRGRSGNRNRCQARREATRRGAPGVQQEDDAAAIPRHGSSEAPVPRQFSAQARRSIARARLHAAGIRRRRSVKAGVGLADPLVHGPGDQPVAAARGTRYLSVRRHRLGQGQTVVRKLPHLRPPLVALGDHVFGPRQRVPASVTASRCRNTPRSGSPVGKRSAGTGVRGPHRPRRAVSRRATVGERSAISTTPGGTRSASESQSAGSVSPPLRDGCRSSHAGRCAAPRRPRPAGDRTRGT